MTAEVTARRTLAFGVVAWLVAWELHAVAGVDLGPLDGRWIHVALPFLAAALCAGAAVRRHRGEERRAWALIAAGILGWAVGETYYVAALWDAAEIPVPSPADAGYLLFPPLVCAGLARLVVARVRDAWRQRLADGLTAAFAACAVGAALVLGPVRGQAEGQGMEVAVNLAYPVVDLVLTGLVVGALAARGWRLDRQWLLLGVGIALFWLADSLYLTGNLVGSYVSGSWFDMGWWVGLLLIGCAAWQEPAAPVARADDQRVRARVLAAPLGFGLMSLAVLVWGCFGAIDPVAVGLAAASLVAVMARTMLSVRENLAMLGASRHEALTDALTGLRNRRALMRDLEEALALDDRPLVLALFDLDGFKHYNDTFGHQAGDALLARLGANLTRHLGAQGTAYRMGGDEFCALVDAQGSRAVLAGAVAALSDRGESFTIACSFGTVDLGVEAIAPGEALKLADQRMYAQKSRGRVSASRQSTDVLVGALAERAPELGGPVPGLADLAGATARALGLAADEVEHVKLATALHDIGKVGVPDSILAKPSRLDAEEWALVHRHPIIGERILTAAPALAAVARIVRSSHERWDGTGYPDGLTGAAIPLGARVVAVADAFGAMTGARSYRCRRSAADALAELRRCAGTQFDPGVVEAFVGAWAKHPAEVNA